MIAYIPFLRDHLPARPPASLPLARPLRCPEALVGLSLRRLHEKQRLQLLGGPHVLLVCHLPDDLKCRPPPGARGCLCSAYRSYRHRGPRAPVRRKNALAHQRLFGRNHSGPGTVRQQPHVVRLAPGVVLLAALELLGHVHCTHMHPQRWASMYIHNVGHAPTPIPFQNPNAGPHRGKGLCKRPRAETSSPVPPHDMALRAAQLSQK